MRWSVGVARSPFPAFVDASIVLIIVPNRRGSAPAGIMTVSLDGGRLWHDNAASVTGGARDR
jgi:hypothetical protein